MLVIAASLLLVNHTQQTSSYVANVLASRFLLAADPIRWRLLRRARSKPSKPTNTACRSLVFFSWVEGCCTQFPLSNHSFYLCKPLNSELPFLGWWAPEKKDTRTGTGVGTSSIF
jgi:hypothetical protein